MQQLGHPFHRRRVVLCFVNVTSQSSGSTMSSIQTFYVISISTYRVTGFPSAAKGTQHSSIHSYALFLQGGKLCDKAVWKSLLLLDSLTLTIYTTAQTPPSCPPQMVTGSLLVQIRPNHRHRETTSFDLVCAVHTASRTEQPCSMQMVSRNKPFVVSTFPE